MARILVVEVFAGRPVSRALIAMSIAALLDDPARVGELRDRAETRLREDYGCNAATARYEVLVEGMLSRSPR